MRAVALGVAGLASAPPASLPRVYDGRVCVCVCDVRLRAEEVCRGEGGERAGCVSRWAAAASL